MIELIVQQDGASLKAVGELVRCKDCEYYGGERGSESGCRYYDINEPNWFCGDGKRREKDEAD